MLRITNIGGFGNKIRISNGVVELDFSTSFGPRILRYALVGGKNFFYEDVDDLGKCDDKLVENFGEGAVWHNYGGHRLWQAPELLPRTYLPDNDEIKYELTDTGVILYQKAFDYTKTVAKIEIVMSEDKPDVKVIHTVKNLSPWEVTFSPWTISVMARDVIEAVPVNKRDTGLLHNQGITVWLYTKLNDPRVYFGNEYITLRQDSSVEGKFKLGFTNENGFAAVFNGEAAFVKTFDYHKDANYPDAGMNFETYTDPVILECESLGRLQTLKEGEELTHTENWTIIPNVTIKDQKDEETISKILSHLRKDK